MGILRCVEEIQTMHGMVLAPTGKGKSFLFNLLFPFFLRLELLSVCSLFFLTSSKIQTFTSSRKVLRFEGIFFNTIHLACMRASVCFENDTIFFYFIFFIFTIIFFFQILLYQTCMFTFRSHDTNCRFWFFIMLTYPDMNGWVLGSHNSPLPMKEGMGGRLTWKFSDQLRFVQRKYILIFVSIRLSWWWRGSFCW